MAKKPVVKKSPVKVAAKSAPKPVSKPASKSATKTPAKPAGKKAVVKPVAKTTMKSVVSAAPVVKPVAKRPAGHSTHSGLGKGLGALIDKPAPIKPTIKPTTLTIQPPAANEVRIFKPGASKAEGSIVSLPISDILRCPWQPRQTFEETALAELADSIRQNGIIQPLICRKRQDGLFELVAGERRLRAATLAELTHVPVILVDAEDRKAAEMAIVENIQRQDLNSIEEAEGYRTLSETFKLSQQEVAERVGKARASVANALRLLDLPDETKQMVADGRLPAGHAKVLLSLKESDDQIILARRCVTEGLTVRALERIVNALIVPREKSAAPKPDLPLSHVRDLTERMHHYFSTAIRLTPGMTHANGRHTKGVLEIDFYDNDDLDRILSLLGIKVD